MQRACEPGQRTLALRGVRSQHVPSRLTLPFLAKGYAAAQPVGQGGCGRCEGCGQPHSSPIPSECCPAQRTGWFEPLAGFEPATSGHTRGVLCPLSYRGSGWEVEPRSTELQLPNLAGALV